MKNILFYVERSLHLPFLEPIEEYLRVNQLAQTAFSAPPFFPGTPSIPAWGLTGEQIVQLEKKAPFFPQPADFSPDATIVADACHFRIPEIKDIINVGHGLICKGAFYTDSPITRRENLSQLLLVPGPWHRRRLATNVLIPMEVTGFIKSDQLFGPQAQSREKFCAQMGIDPRQKIVLFAPTYNPELSTIPCVGTQIHKIADPETTLLIKLHNESDHTWKKMYQDLSTTHPNIFYLADTDYSGMMHAADLMISDVSSIFIEFLLLDKPVVLFNNPRIKEFIYYQADDIEYKTRDAAVQVSTLEELVAAVKSELHNPGARQTIRQRYALSLDHGRDGHCAKRAAEKIMAWAKNKRPAAALTVILLESEDATPEDILRDLAALKTTSWDLHIAVLGGRSQVTGPEIHIPGPLNQIALHKFLSTLTTQRVVFLGEGLRMPRNWPKWLNNHFAWNQNTGAVKALTDPELAMQCMQQEHPANRPIADQEILSFALLTAAIGQSCPGRDLLSECIMFEQEVARTIPKYLPAKTPREYLMLLGQLAWQEQLQVRLALDCYVYPDDLEKKIRQDMRFLINCGQPDQAVRLGKKFLART